MAKKKIEDVQVTEVNEEEIDEQMFEESTYEFKALDIAKMDKSLKESIVSITSKQEARYIVDTYYQVQRSRIIKESQLRAITQKTDTAEEGTVIEKVLAKDDKKPIPFMEWMLYNNQLEENQIAKALDLYSDSNYLAKWAKANIGIGPVIASCLCAMLEITEDTPGHTNMHAGNWWSYAGLNDNNRPWLSRETCRKIVSEAISNNGSIEEALPEIAAKTKWSITHLENKGKDKNGNYTTDSLSAACAIVPYNKKLKVLCYKIGHSFLMCKNKDDSLYGKLLKQREALETSKNLNGDYAEQALEKAKCVGKGTVAYKYYSQGQLPPAHIKQRCQRYVTKLFISHLFEAAYYNKYGELPPNPYVMDFGGHHDYIGPEVSYDSIPRDEVEKES